MAVWSASDRLLYEILGWFLELSSSPLLWARQSNLVSEKPPSSFGFHSNCWHLVLVKISNSPALNFGAIALSDFKLPYGFWFCWLFGEALRWGIFTGSSAGATNGFCNAISQVLFSYFSDAKHSNILNKAIQYAHITFYCFLNWGSSFLHPCIFAIPLFYGKDFSRCGWMIGYCCWECCLLRLTIFSLRSCRHNGSSLISHQSYRSCILRRLGIYCWFHAEGYGRHFASVISYNASNVYIYYKFITTTGNKIWKIIHCVLPKYESLFLQLAVLRKKLNLLFFFVY